MKFNKIRLEDNQEEIVDLLFYLNKRKLFKAYLFLVLLGWCGGHQFYLKKYTYGIFYLLLLGTCLIFDIFLLFIPAIIMGIFLLIDAILLPLYTRDSNNKIKCNLYLKLLTFNQALKINNGVNFNMGDYFKALERQIQKCDKITDMDLIKMDEKIEDINNQANFLIFNHGERQTFNMGEFIKKNSAGIIAIILASAGLVYFSYVMKQATVTATTVAVEQVLKSDAIKNIALDEVVEKAVREAVYKALRDSLDNVLKKEGKEQ